MVVSKMTNLILDKPGESTRCCHLRQRAILDNLNRSAKPRPKRRRDDHADVGRRNQQGSLTALESKQARLAFAPSKAQRHGLEPMREIHTATIGYGFLVDSGLSNRSCRRTSFKTPQPSSRDIAETPKVPQGLTLEILAIESHSRSAVHFPLTTLGLWSSSSAPTTSRLWNHKPTARY